MSFECHSRKNKNRKQKQNIFFTWFVLFTIIYCSYCLPISQWELNCHLDRERSLSLFWCCKHLLWYPILVRDEKQNALQLKLFNLLIVVDDFFFFLEKWIWISVSVACSKTVSHNSHWEPVKGMVYCLQIMLHSIRSVHGSIEFDAMAESVFVQD